MKYKSYLSLMGLAFAGYITFMLASCSTAELPEQTQTSSYQRNDAELEKSRTEENTTMPELNEEEQADLEAEIVETRLEATEEVDKKSVEQMRDEVHEILDEIIETDSTVTISFNMQVDNPLSK